MPTLEYLAIDVYSLVLYFYTHALIDGVMIHMLWRIRRIYFPRVRESRGVIRVRKKNKEERESD